MGAAGVKTILLLEEDTLIARSEAQTIERFGYDVILAHSGEKGVQIALTDASVSLILMDIDLGKGIDGSEAARQILDKRSLPIVFLTSHGEREMVEKVQGIVRYGYVLKNSGDCVLQSSLEMAFALFEANAKLGKELSDSKRAEQHLNGERDLLSTIINTIPDEIAVKDLERRFVLANPSCVHALGKESAGEVLGKRDEDLIPERFAEVSRREEEQVLATGEPVLNREGQARIDPVSGKTKRALLQSKSLIRDNHGMAAGLVVINRDITKRKHAEAALRVSEERLNEVAEQSRTIAWQIDAEGMITYVSRVFETVLGYKEEDVVGKKHFYDIHPEAGREAFKDAAFALLARKAPFQNLESIVQAADGREVWVSINGLPFLDDDGRLLGYRGSDTDITERKRAERFAEALYGISQAIHATENLNDFFAHIHRALSGIMPARNFFIAILSNDETTITFPYERDENETNGSIGIAADDPQSLTAEVLRSRRPLLLNESELQSRYASGQTKVWFTTPKCWLGVPLMIRDHAFGVLAVQDYHRSDEYGPKDVALFESIAGQIAMAIERKRSEERLTQSISLLQATLDSTEEGILVVDKSGKITSYNNQFVTMWRLPRDVMESGDDERALQHVVEQLKHPEGFVAKVRQLYDRPEENSFDVLAFNDGRIFERYSLPQRVEGKPVGRVWSFRDITARKKAEYGTRLLAHTVSSIKDCVSIADLDDRLVFVNSAFLQTYGFTQEELMGREIAIVRSPMTSSKIGNRIHAATLAGGWSGEIMNRRKDGSDFPVELWTSVVRDDKGNILATVGVARDITDRKLAESQREAAVEELHGTLREMRETNLRLEEATVYATALAVQAESASKAKGQFLANMSHEIRTPMNGVIGMTGLLLDSDLSIEQRQCAEAVRASGEALLALINDILDFSKIEAGKLDLELLDFDLGVILEDTAELLAFKAQEKGLDIVCLIESDVPVLLRGDPGRLRQIILNLGGNAIKFTEQGGITLRAGRVAESDRHATIRFAVTDTGIGIPRDKQEKLFSPFIQVDGSTSRKYGGTGLGLAISKDLAELMGGVIGVESPPAPLTPGGESGGSTFWFTAVFEKRPAEQIPEQTPSPDLSGVRVLVVDGNGTNRLLVTMMLKKWGCRSTEALNGGAAQDRLREAAAGGDPYSVALLDMVLPDMDGAELGRRIKESPDHHDTRLIMMMSIGRQGDRVRFTGLGFTGFLTKPLRQSQVRECLADVLGLSKEKAPLPSRDYASGTTGSGTHTRTARILLAEDNAINQIVGLKILQKLGYRADPVANGLEVIQALETIPYDLVLMDCQMPEMDGFEATRAIRKMNMDIPIIALTANAMKGDRELCLDAGMNDYLSKPVKSADMAAILDRWLKRDHPPG
jgi:PAS domain S-box-containing protein